MAARAADRRRGRERRPARDRRRGARPGRLARPGRRRRAGRRGLRPPRVARRRRCAGGAQRARGRGRAGRGEDVRDAEGRVSPTLEDVEAAAQQRILAYDRAGDGHYDTVSAFIKSLRGNDPDAALYWLAAMIAAGEDPKFIARRLIISASEDVGNADPRALSGGGRGGAGARLDRPARGAVRAGPGDDLHRHGAEVEPRRRGLLGGRRPTSRPAARCRSRSTCATPPIARMKQHGIGVGYRYPHDYEGADVEQQYLPDALADRRYYLPTDQGYESTIAARMAARPRPARLPRRPAGPRDPASPPRRSRRERGDGHHEDPRDEPQEAGRDREARRRQLADIDRAQDIVT